MQEDDDVNNVMIDGDYYYYGCTQLLQQQQDTTTLTISSPRLPSVVELASHPRGKPLAEMQMEGGMCEK